MSDDDETTGPQRPELRVVPPVPLSPPPPGLNPDDFIQHGKNKGRVRCFARARTRDGARCSQPAVDGSSVCRYHGAGGRLKHPDDPSFNGHEGSQARLRKIEAVRARLEEVATHAVDAVMLVLTDEMAKPADRLKAAELILDRTIGRQLTLDQANADERDLDVEIEQLLELGATGTDGFVSGSEYVPDPPSE